MYIMMLVDTNSFLAWREVMARLTVTWSAAAGMAGRLSSGRVGQTRPPATLAAPSE